MARFCSWDVLYIRNGFDLKYCWLRTCCLGGTRESRLVLSESPCVKTSQHGPLRGCFATLSRVLRDVKWTVGTRPAKLAYTLLRQCHISNYARRSVALFPNGKGSI